MYILGLSVPTQGLLRAVVLLGVGYAAGPRISFNLRFKFMMPANRKSIKSSVSITIKPATEMILLAEGGYMNINSHHDHA